MKYFLTCIFLLTSCGQHVIMENTKHSSLIKMEASDCKGSLGISFLYGLDENDSGLLEEYEVTSENKICYGFKVIDPCGPSGGYDEILLQMDETTIIAYFKNGSFEHLARLDVGSYITTDSQACLFTITEDYDIQF